MSIFGQTITDRFQKRTKSAYITTIRLAGNQFFALKFLSKLLNWFHQNNFIQKNSFFQKIPKLHKLSSHLFWKHFLTTFIFKLFGKILISHEIQKKKSQHCAFVFIIEEKPHNYERSYSEHSTFMAFEVPRWTVHAATIVHAFVQWITHPNAPPSFFYRLEFLLGAISVKLPLKHLLCLFGLFVRYQPVRIGSCLCHTVYISRLLLFHWVEAFA